jgi:hypothetical protein
MNARLALPAADLIVGIKRHLQMTFAASVPLQHHDQIRPAVRPIGRVGFASTGDRRLHGILVC